MPLNTEDRYEQEDFERRHYSRPTSNQIKVAMLENQLKHAQDSLKYYEAEVTQLEEELTLVRNTNDHINNELDKRINQLDQVNGIIRDVKTNKISDAMFKSNIITAMGWER